MQKFFNITNHTLTADQKEDAISFMGEIEFVELEPELKKLWGSIPQEESIEGVARYLAPVLNYIARTVEPSDWVYLAGDYTAVSLAAAVAEQANVGAYTSTSNSISKHVTFRYILGNPNYLDAADLVDEIWEGTKWEKSKLDN